MKRVSHMFVVCAYKESRYLEACIQSLLAQTIQTKTAITTSTPNGHIKSLAYKYHLPFYGREGESDICADWNFAYDAADTDWVTIAHQDDVYHKCYAEEMHKILGKTDDAVAFTTDYIPIKNGQVGPRDINSKLRRLLRSPLKSPFLAKTKFWKKGILCFGNSICCPSVSYNKAVLGNSFFTTDLKYNIDWDTFLKIAEMDGAFAYVDKPLTYYRVHGEAASMEWIKKHTREKEDLYMFQKFWPNWVAGLIMHFYKRAYDTYGEEGEN